MANNYTQFSEMIKNLTAEERAWIEEKISRWNSSEGADESPPEDMPVSWIDAWENEGLPVDFEFDGDSVLLYSEESGSVDAVLDFVKMFLAKFRPEEEFHLGWAYTCSKMRPGEFGGGSAVVTAKEIRACAGECLQKAPVYTAVILGDHDPIVFVAESEDALYGALSESLLGNYAVEDAGNPEAYLAATTPADKVCAFFDGNESQFIHFDTTELDD